MPDSIPSAPRSSWTGDITRVPYWVYRDPDLLKTEQERVFGDQYGISFALKARLPIRATGGRPYSAACRW